LTARTVPEGSANVLGSVQVASMERRDFWMSYNLEK